MPPKVSCKCAVYGCCNVPAGSVPLTQKAYADHQRLQQKADVMAKVHQEAAAKDAEKAAAEAQAAADAEVQDAEEMEKNRESLRQKARQAAAAATARKKRKERKEKSEQATQSELQKRATEAKDAIERLAREELELLSQFSPTSYPLPQTREHARFRIDHERNQVGIMATILDAQEIVDQQLDLLRTPPADINLAGLDAGVQRLNSLSAQSSSIFRDLRTIQASKRFPAAQTLRDEAFLRAASQTQEIDATLTEWREAIATKIHLRSNGQAEHYDTSHLWAPILGHYLPPVQVVMFMVVVCSIILSFSRRGCAWLFDMGRAVIAESFTLAGNTWRGGIPHDLRTITDQFNLDCKSVTFAVCPDCHHIYPPTEMQGSFPVYPEKCNYSRYNRGKRCKSILVRPTTVNKMTRYVPIKPFVSFNFNDWLGRLMLHPGNEKAMDDKWLELKDDPEFMSPEELEKFSQQEELADIFDGSIVRSFKGLDGYTHFSVPSTEGEGRYLFSLGFDFFNPLTNKQAGKKLSCGAFSLVCLNLPVEERYKPENMFLAGIIPGPKEPKLDHINSFWGPIVDCFEKLWYDGVYFSKTAEHPHGRLVRCAIVALVCDLLAARKIGGMASCQHEWFCSRCLCSLAVKRSDPRFNRRGGQKHQAWNAKQRGRKAELHAEAEIKRKREAEMKAEAEIKRKRKRDAEDIADDEQEAKEAEMARAERGDEESGSEGSSESANSVEGETDEENSEENEENSESENSAEHGEENAAENGAQKGENRFEGEGTAGHRSGYNNYDVDNWTDRSDAQCRRWADKYRFAKTDAEAKRYFNKSGMRWTEFLRLPYFDLTTMLVIDSMHNMFLGLLREHFRNILGFRPTKTTKTPSPVLAVIITPSETNPLPVAATELATLKKTLNALARPMADDLKDPSKRQIIQDRVTNGAHHATLVYIAKGFGCTDIRKQKIEPGETNLKKIYIAKAGLVKKILDWRAGQIEVPTEPDPDTTPEAITQVEKEALWADLARIVKPSWMTSVPPTFGGESSDGKLKADQWRTLGTVFMPLTLIRLWSASKPGSHRRELLYLTMDLVSAIIVASSRVTSGANANLCLEHLKNYRRRLSRLFPDYTCHPNHHMVMHLPVSLLLFGPIHGWWTFPFERVIGKLQRVPTNYKPGEYEATIGRNYHKMANLKLISTSHIFPAALQPLTQFLEKLIRPQSRNIFLDDEVGNGSSPVNAKKLREAEAPIAAALQNMQNRTAPSQIVTLTATTYKGVRYTTNTRHAGNSSVFKNQPKPVPAPVLNPTEPVPAPTEPVVPRTPTYFNYHPLPLIIQHIVMDEAGIVYVLVKRLTSIKVIDPFEPFKVLGAKIYSRCDKLAPDLEAYPISDIDGHFASLNVDAQTNDGRTVQAAVILPLRKSILFDYEEVWGELEVQEVLYEGPTDI